MKGYIYVLENPAMPQIHKIGKTTRDPFARAEELSASTGIPTAFVLVFQQSFNDCHKAEKKIHASLTARQGRLSNSREFFTTSLKDIIQLIQEVKLEDDLLSKNDEDTLTKPETIEVQREQLLKGAIFKYLGLGDVIQDPYEARDAFILASELGNIFANRWLAIMYYQGHGGRRSDKKAFDYLKKGLLAGDLNCLVLLAILSEKSRKYQNYSNSVKYWRRYKDAIEHIENREENFIYLYEFICHELNKAVGDSVPNFEYINWESSLLENYLRNKEIRQEKTELTFEEAILFYQEDFLSNLTGVVTLLAKDRGLVQNQTYFFSKYDEAFSILVYQGKRELNIGGENNEYLYFANPIHSDKNMNMKHSQFKDYLKNNTCYPIYSNDSKEFIKYVSNFIAK